MFESRQRQNLESLNDTPLPRSTSAKHALSRVPQKRRLIGHLVKDGTKDAMALHVVKVSKNTPDVAGFPPNGHRKASRPDLCQIFSVKPTQRGIVV